jgi:hypothetical protein
MGLTAMMMQVLCCPLLMLGPMYPIAFPQVPCMSVAGAFLGMEQMDLLLLVLQKQVSDEEIPTPCLHAPPPLPPCAFDQLAHRQGLEVSNRTS